VLREPHERRSPFGRRDAVRLVVAAVLIVAALAAGVASDLTPSNPNLAAGTIAQSAIVAPRDATIPNAVETKLAQDAAEAKIEALLTAALGTGHASVAVSADVDTSKVEADITTYAPSGSNPPVSISQNIEQYGATGTSGACGIPLRPPGGWKPPPTWTRCAGVPCCCAGSPSTRTPART